MTKYDAFNNFGITSKPLHPTAAIHSIANASASNFKCSPLQTHHLTTSNAHHGKRYIKQLQRSSIAKTSPTYRICTTTIANTVYSSEILQMTSIAIFSSTTASALHSHRTIKNTANAPMQALHLITEMPIIANASFTANALHCKRFL